MHIAIIGGGAAGCFAAIELKRRMPETRVTVCENGSRLLAKVAITGGGRCNLTNSFREVRSIESVYPRGHRLMKRLLREFSHEDAFRWFEQEGVHLTTQSDQCVFPVSQDAMEIVNTLIDRMRSEGVIIKTNCRIASIEHSENGYAVRPVGGGCIEADAVLVTTGGSPRLSGFDWLAPLGLNIVPPVPSLFSFCLPGSPITELMGTVVAEAVASLPGTKFKAEGALLITHWGVSGPAVLKLSSHAARHLSECGYRAKLSINWLGGANEQEAQSLIADLAEAHPQKQLSSVYPPVLNSRLWAHLLHQNHLSPTLRWCELPNKGRNKLAAVLTADLYDIDGKNRFKEEFVTCGGISLADINPKTMEHRQHPGLYFAGEVLDLDAITGGFNLQAAWTTGYVAAKGMADKNK